MKKGWTFTPPAVIVEAVLEHYKKTGSRLLESWWSRTDVQSSDGSFVGVGDFDSDGLNVYGDTRDYTISGLGVCPSRLVSRKFDSSELVSLDLDSLDRIKRLEKEMEKLK